jgi:hypothetical protein
VKAKILVIHCSLQSTVLLPLLPVLLNKGLQKEHDELLALIMLSREDINMGTTDHNIHCTPLIFRCENYSTCSDAIGKTVSDHQGMQYVYTVKRNRTIQSYLSK